MNVIFAIVLTIFAVLIGVLWHDNNITHESLEMIVDLLQDEKNLDDRTEKRIKKIEKNIEVIELKGRTGIW